MNMYIQFRYNVSIVHILCHVISFPDDLEMKTLRYVM